VLHASMLINLSHECAPFTSASSISFDFVLIFQSFTSLSHTHTRINPKNVSLDRSLKPLLDPNTTK
jgi:hypothetical protein